MKILLAVLLCGSLLAAPMASGASQNRPYVLKLLKRGNSVEIDPATFPKEMQEGYRLMTVHCTECHEQDRIIEVLHTGKSRRGTPYGEQNFHEKIIHVMRMGGVAMSRDDAKKLSDFFTFLVTRVKSN